MVPTLLVGPVEVPTHEVFVMAGVLTAVLLFRHEVRLRPAQRSRSLWSVGAGALLGGAVMAKASTAWRLVGQAGGVTAWDVLAHGGKSLVGGLAGAYGGAVLMKRLIGHRQSTGDVFTPGVVAGIAVGRVGCFLTEQIGTPTTLPWGVVPPARTAAGIPNCPQCLLGVPLHPSFLYEIAFLLLLLVGVYRLRGRLAVEGDLFKLFLLSYGLFRFLVEFVRGNEVLLLGLTGTQVFLIASLPLLIGYFGSQIRRGVYRQTRSMVGVPV